jgi:hypothetical protein
MCFKMLLLMMVIDTVEMIKQFPVEVAFCGSLSFHGDAVYIGNSGCVIRWNVATDAVVRLWGFRGSIF